MTKAEKLVYKVQLHIELYDTIPNEKNYLEGPMNLIDWLLIPSKLVQYVTLFFTKRFVFSQHNEKVCYIALLLCCGQQSY